jgi:hypothetical protein
MALIREITELQRARQHVQGVVDCTYSVFTSGGARYLQLDTYGSPDRATPGKVSQTLQFDAAGAEQLLKLLQRVFPELR